MSDAVIGEAAGDLPGQPDGFGRLWTPHRMAYIERSASGECPFCRAPGLSDEEGLIVHRGELCYVVMNLYPYSPGHLLICPYRHVPLYDELTDEETAEFSALSQQAMRVLRSVSAPAGFNLGMNQGDVAGAGVAAHLHQHVVPRWLGDSNFFPIIGQTRAVPVLLGDTRTLVAQAWGSAC